MAEHLHSLQAAVCELGQERADEAARHKPYLTGRTPILVGHRVLVPCSLKTEGVFAPRTTLPGLLQIDLKKETWRGIIGLFPSMRFGKCFLHEDKMIWVGSMDYQLRIHEKLSVSAFDLVTADWQNFPVLGSPPCLRKMFSLDFIEAKEMCVVFGGVRTRNNAILRDQVHLLDLERSEWVQPIVKGAPPGPLAGHGTCVYNDLIYCYGGTNGIASSSDMFILNVASRSAVIWSKAILDRCGRDPFYLSSFSLVPFKGMLILLGGHGSQRGIHVYDPTTSELSDLHRTITALSGTQNSSVRGIPLDGGNAIGVFGLERGAHRYLRICRKS